MSEKAMWEAIRPVMNGLHPVRIESSTAEGIPDVNYTHGWIELKYARVWPKRKTTPLRLAHFTVEQRAWLTERWASGGKTFVLLKVGRDEWLLFRGQTAAIVLGYSPRARLYEEVVARWERKPKKEELQRWLR